MQFLYFVMEYANEALDEENALCVEHNSVRKQRNLGLNGGHKLMQTD
jgi:hypothetical protein